MKKKPSLLTFSIYLITITIISAIIFIYYFYKTLGPNLIKCAEDEVRHLTSLIMNNCVQKYIDQESDISLINIEKNTKGEINRIQYNTKILNQTRNKILDILETDLDYMSSGKLELLDLNPNQLSDEYYQKTNSKIIFMISVGSSTSNPFFANLGPKIPLNLKTIGDATANITTDIKSYGMNNALIEVGIELEATTIIHMPFMSKKVIVKNKIPLTIEIIQGNIPNYYFEEENNNN